MCTTQWNPVNTDTKGTCQNVRIIRVFIFSGLSDIKSNPCDNVIFKATKCLNCTLALISLNYENLIVVYHTLEEICTKNQAEILTALNHCLVSSAIVTLTTTSLISRTVHKSTHSVLSE